MSPFGPWYPVTLQRAVSHAERVVDLLSAQELLPARAILPASTRAWLWGRSAEVGCYVSSVVEEWRDGGRDERSAAAAIDDYLVFLHHGLAEHLGLREPRCCDLADTALLEGALEPAADATRVDDCVFRAVSGTWS